MQWSEAYLKYENSQNNFTTQGEKERASLGRKQQQHIQNISSK